MNIEQIEENISRVLQNFEQDSFIFDLLLAYGTPKNTITLLKKGQRNLSKQEGLIILKRKLFFKIVEHQDLHEAIDDLQKNSTTTRHLPRFIIVTDFKTILAVDTKTKEHLDCLISDLGKYYDFFLPWAGIEKHRHVNENFADRKAAEKMARLYDQVLAENSITDDDQIYALNIFLARLLFCFFAEDTGIFESKIFTDSIASHTQIDGSDLHDYLQKLFKVLNTKNNLDYPAYLQKFPYVNGGLFKEAHWIPSFSAKSRKIIIECGTLDWSQINPDIFGSMMQAVVHPTERGSLGMHYTSVPNIMKVIEPLFLNEFNKEFNESKGNRRRLEKLLDRLSRVKFFDPACGSGNFLIITYKEMRRLEMAVLKELNSVAYFPSNLDKYHGIEIDHFAHEITKLSLYIAEHQMNVEFYDQFGAVNPTLPLKTGGNIICANATRVAWEDVCPRGEGDEIYVFGNPPYLGARIQTSTHKSDINLVFAGFKKYKDLDYIACWFYLAGIYAKDNNVKFSFVTTNSVCQGEQVALLWPMLFNLKLDIFFAHTSFKWSNNAKKNAGVTVVIIGIKNEGEKNNKIIYHDNLGRTVSYINPYLIEGRNIIIQRRTKALSLFPEMKFGNMPNDGGHLILTTSEKNDIIKDFPNTEKFFRKLIGSLEFFKGAVRWCIWLNKEDLSIALSVPPIFDRIKGTENHRLASKDKGTQKLAQRSYQFRDLNVAKKYLYIIPRVSSERRRYIPIGMLDHSYIVSDSAQVIYDADPWIFGVISSRMHMTWVRTVAGRLKTDYRYSSALCYNTFPIPFLTTKQKEDITSCVYSILEEREKHPEKTIADLYDPDKMPVDLQEAHNQLDLVIERCYRSRLFTDDVERLEFLFKLYEQMILEEKNVIGSK